MNGWESYTTRDVSTAAWNASRKDGLRWERRAEIFAAHLEGKEVTPEHRLDVSKVTFADEIMEMDGLLDFYVATDFDPDRAFGTNVCTDENDDWVNVYANYDIAKGQVCDALEVNLCRGDGTEKTMLYHLSPAEKKVLAGKMEVFCLEQTGLSLNDYRAKIQSEEIRVMDSEKGVPVPDAPQKTSRAAAPKKASKTRNADRGAR